MTNRQLQDFLRKLPDGTPVRRLTSLQSDGFLTNNPKDLFGKVGFSVMAIEGELSIIVSYE